MKNIINLYYSQVLYIYSDSENPAPPEVNDAALWINK